MDPNGTLERIAMTNGTEGGVLHLLRLTRTQCHAWVAFVALRREDGTIDITAVPGPDDEGSEWTHETLEGIVRQTLEDPLIGEGRAVIRVSEVFRRYWPGERQYTRMAVAPLNDVAEPGRPWGLLCALDPVDGQFSEGQLDMLGRLAVRFLNHLRVRRQFVDDAAASEALLSAALPAEPIEVPADEPMVPADEPAALVDEPAALADEDLPDEGIVRIERAATWLTRREPRPAAQSAPVAPEPTEAASEHGSEQVQVVFDQTFTVGDASPLPGDVPAASAASAASEVGGEVDEVHADQSQPEAEAPAAVEEQVEEPAEEPEAPAAAVAPSAGAGTLDVSTTAGAPRKVRLSELIEQLDGTLDRLRARQRRGALFLVELSSGHELSSSEQVEAAAARLAEATRHSDLVLGVGSDMLAVVMELGPRAARLEELVERLRSASAGDDDGGAMRASIVSLDPDQVPNGEALVLAAVRRLGTR